MIENNGGKLRNNTIYKLVESRAFNFSHEEFRGWKEGLISFISNYTKDKYLSVFDAVPGTESVFSSYFSFEFRFKYKGDEYFFAYGKDILSEGDIKEFFSYSEFSLGNSALIPSLLSDDEKINLINNWDGDRLCSGIEMFIMGEDGESFKWYNPQHSDPEKLLSDYMSHNIKPEMCTYQVLESSIEEYDEDEYSQWKSKTLQFLFDYLKGKPITLFESDYGKSKVIDYALVTKKIKYHGKKKLLACIENGISYELLNQIFDLDEFASGNIAMIPSLLSKTQQMMLLVYWDIDKVYNGMEMFVMGRKGRTFKWYNPQHPNPSFIFTGF